MKLKSFKLTALAFGAMMLAGSALCAAPANAATPAELEAKIKQMEQSLDVMKAQLAGVQATQAQVAAKAEVAADDKLPGWAERISFYGDTRMRFNSSIKEDRDTRNRFRVRLRFGAKSQIHKDVEVGVRMVTGADNDASSTNQTMGNFFSEFSAWGLDTAYVKWTPSMVPDKMLTALFGKVSNPMVVSKVNYDGDVRPEGAFLQLHLNKKGAFQPFATGGVMFISEHSSDPPEDAYAWVGQVGVKGKMGPAKFTLAAGYTDWGEFGTVGNLPEEIGGNTVYTNAADEEYLSEFGCFDIYGKVAIKVMDKAEISAWGHFIQNTQASGVHDDKDTAYGAGLGFKYQAFKLSAWYKSVQANAWPGFTTDSDSYFANYNTWVVGGKWKVFDRGELGVTYFNGTPEDVDLGGYDRQDVMVDFVFKW